MSVIINNYNYGCYLSAAIDSALAQTYRPLEVIVVDDGSSDESLDVLTSYADGITSVRKENGGQASAFNAGLRASQGDIVIFLDADDALLPPAAAHAAELFEPDVVKVHWPLWRTGESLDYASGRRIPAESLPSGDLRALTFAQGPHRTISPPTSGNAWSRTFLERVMPIPEADHRIGADGYLFGLAPAFGLLQALTEPHGFYRVHDRNSYVRRPFEERVRLGVSSIEHQWRVLRRYAGECGEAVDEAIWVENSYFHQLQTAAKELQRCVPAGSVVVLVDESKWAMDPDFAGRTIVPFPDVDGMYGGIPADDSCAIAELERLRKSHSADYLAIVWSSFWWLEHYSGFAHHLTANYPVLLEGKLLRVFNLKG